jgi:hypothetical protein
MQTHIFTLKYSGLLAEHGVMEAAHGEYALQGAKKLLAAHCHYYTKGTIPHRPIAQTHDFQILVSTPGRGSYFLDLLVSVSHSAIYDVAKVGILAILIPVVKEWSKHGRLSKNWFYGDSVLAQPVSVMDRIEPILPMPIHGANSLRDAQLKLFDKTNHAMTSIVQPVGRSASCVDVLADNELIDSFGVHQLPTAKPRDPLEVSIARAIEQMRERRNTQH